MRDNTKEQIKNRMLKKAATLWDVPANEIGDSFDPVISLLLSACASELEKLSGDIDDSHTRITERLIQLMTPLSVFDTKPAHSIVVCESIEPKTLITPEHELFYKKKPESGSVLKAHKDIFFSPTQTTKLVDARIKHLFTGNKLYTFEERKTKELTNVLSKDYALDSGEFFLGIENTNANLDLNDVSFYFEHLGVTENELFYHHLHNATWYLGKEKIDVIHGYYNSNEVDNIDLDAIFSGVASKINTISREVNEYYEKHFITLKHSKKISKSPKYEALSKIKDPENEAFFDEKIIWIKIHISTVIGAKFLEQLFCTINAFPVLNRKVNQFSYQMKNFVDIIPLLSDEPFLDVKSMENSKGEVYQLEQTAVDDSRKGSYFVRGANVGKLDSRKSKEYITHLLELLKDESAAFTFFNQEFLQNNLNGLSQTIALVEKKLNEVADTSSYTNYIYLTPYGNNENIETTYWTTDGEYANHIKTGRLLEVYKGANLKPKGAYFLRPVFGGSNSLTMTQRLQAYRRVSLTNNRIVTEEDLKSVCYDLYGDHITHVEISKGFTTDVSLGKGLVQCIEIIMIPSKNVTLQSYEWEYLNKNLLSTLKKQAVNIFPFKIIIKDK